MREDKITVVNNEISVIVPVYKVEKYLDRCIISILNQTYTDFELILVDDGSPDNCGDMCDSWVEKDNRIKVIHKVNGGLSDARNAGIRSSTSPFITFIDSDDFVDKDYLMYLYDNLIQNDADISICDFTYVYGTESQVEFQSDGQFETECLDSKQYCINLFKKGLHHTAWGKLYKRYLFEEIMFPVGHVCEDTAIMGKLFYNSKRIVYGTKKLYAYYYNPESIMNKGNEKQKMDSLWALNENITFYADENEMEIVKYAVRMLGAMLLSYLRQNCIKRKTIENYYKKYKKYSNFDLLYWKLFFAINFPYLYSRLMGFVALMKKVIINSILKDGTN